MEKLRQLLVCYDLSECNIPEEVLNIVVGDKMYDKKYFKIKKYFLSLIRAKFNWDNYNLSIT